MRPPEHWNLRSSRRAVVPRRRSDTGWWLLIAFAGLIVGVLLVRQELFAGSDPSSPNLESSVHSAQQPPGPDAPADAESVPGGECGIGSDDCPPAEPPVCAEGAACEPRREVASGVSAEPDYLVPATQPPPSISGVAAAVMEDSCGALLYGRNLHDRRAPASLTKMMTALVAVERTDPAETVDINVNGTLMKQSTGSSVIGLQPGQQLSMNDLMHGLLMASGNDAAIAIAEHVSGTVPAFVALMNAKAQELGLQDTRFANPHGLDEAGLYSSPYDLAVLGREVLADPELARIVATVTYQPARDGPQLWNGNKLLFEYEGAIGVKTGYTADAGQTIVAAAERDGRRLIVSVMGSWDRFGDAVALFEWAFAHTTSPCPAFPG